MKHVAELTRRIAWLRFVAAMILAMGALVPPQTLAQVPARFYWKTLSGSNAIPLIVDSISGNTNPFDPAQAVTPGRERRRHHGDRGVCAQLRPVRSLGPWRRSSCPWGGSRATCTVAGKTVNQSANGFGDPMLEFNVNLLGPTAQKNLPDVLRYEPGFSVDLLADLALPIGEYDSSQPLNLGQNRWYGRVGMPVIWQLGAWVPGRRTTLEFLPAVWLFGNNNDYVGQTLKTDPLFQLDAHLTRDFTEHFWGSLDAPGTTAARRPSTASRGEKLNNLGVGLTLGYQVNDNLNLTVRLQVDRERQRTRRPAHGPLHDHARVRVAPAHRRIAAAEERVNWRGSGNCAGDEHARPYANLPDDPFQREYGRRIAERNDAHYKVGDPVPPHAH